MAFKLLSKIDERTKLSVHGWIRNKEKTLKLRNIPSMVNAICILYFRDDEVFEINHDNMKVSENKKTITKISDNWGWTSCSYGLNAINSNSDMTYQWDLNIKNPEGKEAGIVVGIASRTKSFRDVWTCTLAPGDLMYLYGNWGHVCDRRDVDKEYGTGISDGNGKISIHLDLKLGQLSFSVNDVNQGIAFENIKKNQDIQYRLVVSLFYVGASVEIINFHKK